MNERPEGASNAERQRVRRMRAQLLTVVSCVAGMGAAYLIAAAMI